MPTDAFSFKNYIKNISSFANTILVKDIVKDMLWITCPLGERYGKRAVVGAVNLRMNFRFFYTVHKFARNEEVVEAPAYISVSCAGLHIPISVCLFCVWVEVAE